MRRLASDAGDGDDGLIGFDRSSNSKYRLQFPTRLHRKKAQVGFHVNAAVAEELMMDWFRPTTDELSTGPINLRVGRSADWN